MRPEEARSLLGGYATGTLTKTEREALMRAALDDPALFEELVEEEDWRAALGDADFRQGLRRRLHELAGEERTSWTDRFRVVFRLRWAISAASAVAALAVLILIRQGNLSESSQVARVVLGPSTIPALRAAGLLEEPGASEARIEAESRSDPPAADRGVALNLDREGTRPVYRMGDRQRIGFRVPADANVLLLEERAGGSSVRLFPNRFQSSAAVSANRTILVPPAGQGDLEVDGPPGRRTLRLLIFPSDVDPLAPDVNWRQVRARARAVERNYEVRP
jgi:Domain of unknown function (DUF4384)